MSSNLIMLVGDHAFAVPRGSLSVADRLRATIARRGTNGEKISGKTTVLDASVAGTSREVIHKGNNALLVLCGMSRFDSMHLVLTVSLGDLPSGGVAPSSWIALVSGFLNTAESLGFATSVLVFDVPTGEQDKKSRRWHRRIGSVAQEAFDPDDGVLGPGVDILKLEARGWPDPLDVGNDGSEQISDLILSSVIL